MPAASSNRFIASLLRKGTVCATFNPGTPSASRRRAASIIPGSQRHSIRSRVRRRQPARDLFDEGRFVPQGADPQVVGEGAAGLGRQRPRRLVADAQHLRADLGQAADEMRHLAGIAGRQEKDSGHRKASRSQ